MVIKQQSQCMYMFSLAGHDVISKILRLETICNISPEFWRYQSDCSGHMTVMLWLLAPCDDMYSDEDNESAIVTASNSWVTVNCVKIRERFF